ncbi:DNA polymerase Y family protein [Kitasatospora acidiphila]|uniref:DNA polymerase Y family protein n=1 Tax=Kitasatospora acidiphila TaxID=2567942 RepID=UPI003C744A82
MDVSGAESYYGEPAGRLAELVRLRCVALLGVDLRIGVADTWALAATASSCVEGSGGVLVVPAGGQQSFLAPLPVAAVDGIGTRQSEKLARGVRTVAQLVAADPGTVERILGGRAGRLAVDRARGIDRRRATPRDLPASARVRHHFQRDALDGPEVRAAVLDLAVQLGAMLRGLGQAALAVAVVVRFAGGPPWERTVRLREPSAHTKDLSEAAYRLMDTAALQRGRITGLLLSGEELLDAERVFTQISLDRPREHGLVVEKAVDRINSRFGDGAVRPASTLRTTR